jgi:hypothetical protein
MLKESGKLKVRIKFELQQGENFLQAILMRRKFMKCRYYLMDRALMVPAELVWLYKNIALRPDKFQKAYFLRYMIT